MGTTQSLFGVEGALGYVWVCGATWVLVMMGYSELLGQHGGLRVFGLKGFRV